MIVLVSIGSAALFAWVAVELGRFTFGEFRVPRLAIGPLRAPANPATPPLERRDAPPPTSEPRALPGEDVEQRVRDRLYGERNGALKRAPSSAE